MTHVYSGLSTLNARDFSLRNVCFGSKSWHWILGFREAGTKSGGFTGFKDICWVANWLVWWKGGDPQTVQHYEKVLQERCFFFWIFRMKVLDPRWDYEKFGRNWRASCLQQQLYRVDSDPRSPARCKNCTSGKWDGYLLIFVDGWNLRFDYGHKKKIWIWFDVLIYLVMSLDIYSVLDKHLTE